MLGEEREALCQSKGIPEKGREISSRLHVVIRMSSFLLLKPSTCGEGSAMKVNKDKGLDRLIPGKQITAQPTGGMVHRWDQQKVEAWPTSG